MSIAHPIDYSYRKDTTLPIGKGYSLRPGGIAPTTIVIHTTNSPHKNTAFSAEASFLRDSPDVGAHFLVGKQGQIAQILSPDLAAWQAGGRQQNGTWTAQPAFANDHSIGIESHVSQGEQWTGAQRDALTWLVRQLMSQYHIAPTQIETHRAIALPLGRKTDPEAWPNEAFYAWRAALASTPPPPPLPVIQKYKVRGLPIHQAQNLQGQTAGFLAPGDVIEVDALYNNGAGHLKSGLGFVDMKGLENAL